MLNRNGLGARALLRSTLATTVVLSLVPGASARPEPVPPPVPDFRPCPLPPDPAGSGAGASPAAVHPEAIQSVPSDTTASPRWTATGGVTFASRYLFQNIDQCGGSSVVQPELQLASGALALSLWLNHRIAGNRLTEVDVGAQYGVTRGIASLSLGYLWLGYAGGSAGQEAVAEVGLDLPLQPALSLHRDFGAGRGLYATAEVSLALPAVPLQCTLAAYYQHSYFGASGCPGGTLSLACAGTWRGLRLEPRISYAGGWKSGDFRGQAAVPSTWVVAFAAGRDL